MSATSNFKFVGELPDGYEYKIFQTLDRFGYDRIKIFGVSPDKGAIGFYIADDGSLNKIELGIDWGKLSPCKPL
jgi:hypothetical protein